jgi:hypothetical protein
MKKKIAFIILFLNLVVFIFIIYGTIQYFNPLINRYSGSTELAVYLNLFFEFLILFVSILAYKEIVKVKWAVYFFVARIWYIIDLFLF